MTHDEFFLDTLDDLEMRCQLGRGEYDALLMAAILRRLFVDDSPLVDTINRLEGRGLKFEFRIRDLGVIAPETETWDPGEFLHCLDGDPAALLLNRHQFFKRPALRAFGHDISVQQLIQFFANKEGAVHLTPTVEPWQQALWDHSWGTTISTPDGGQLPGPMYILGAAARIVLDALEPLRTLVSQQARPAHLPAGARRKVRDPSNRGWPTN